MRGAQTTLGNLIVVNYCKGVQMLGGTLMYVLAQTPVAQGTVLAVGAPPHTNAWTVQVRWWLPGMRRALNVNDHCACQSRGLTAA